MNMLRHHDKFVNLKIALILIIPEHIDEQTRAAFAFEENIPAVRDRCDKKCALILGKFDHLRTGDKAQLLHTIHSRAVKARASTISM